MVRSKRWGLVLATDQVPGHEGVTVFSSSLCTFFVRYPVLQLLQRPNQGGPWEARGRQSEGRWVCGEVFCDNFGAIQQGS